MPPPIPTATKPPAAAPDSHINPTAAIAYWTATSPTVDGVLGGYPQVSRVDLQGSANFLAKLRRSSAQHPAGKKLARVADCGAGIGRVTTGFLRKVAQEVDVVEPVTGFTDVVKGEEGVRRVVNKGLEEWFPGEERLGGGEAVVYDLVWNQWCVGQLTDKALVAYLRRLPAVLSEGGWVVVKENLSTDGEGADVYDETDSSVTRTDGKFREIFREAGLKIVATEVQKGFPADLYPVRSYALQPS